MKHLCSFVYALARPGRAWLAALPLLLALGARAQTVLQTESFETDGEGSRYTSNSFLPGTADGSIVGTKTNNAYFLRATETSSSPTISSANWPLIPVSGGALAGTYFWAGEGIRGPDDTRYDRPPGFVQLSAVSVAGYRSLQVKVAFLDARTNGFNWENSDTIKVQVRFGTSSPWVTVGQFVGDDSDGGGGGLMRQDGNLNGITSDAADASSPTWNTSMADYTFNVPATGSTLQTRVLASQNGLSEEFGFDNIRVLGTAYSASAPVLAGMESSTQGYPTANAQVALTNTLTVSDADNTTLSSALVRFAAIKDATNDVLSFAGTAATGNITGTFDASTRTLALTSAGATATLAQWQAALRLVKFQTSTGFPAPGRDRAVLFVVTDPSGTASNAAFRRVGYSTAPTITLAPTSLSAGTVGTAYSQALTATGGSSPYTYAVTTGTLPTGLTLSSSGALTGTPTAAGAYSFTVTATDASTGAGPYTGSQAYTLTISATAATVTTTAPASITSTSATLGGNVTVDGGATITERGVVYVAGAGTPTTANPKLTAAGTTGGYTTSATGLTASTLYTVRAYAINSVGTSYGSNQTFTTAAPAPAFTTQPSGANVCQNATATLTAAASGATGYQWYNNGSTNANTGGTLISGATSASYSAPTTAGGTYYYYYVVATNGTGSTASNAVAGVVTATAAPTGSASQSFSPGATVASLAATGTALQWYAASTGGSALASTTALVNGTTYYATQTVSGCESQTRLAVTATVTGPTALTVSTGTPASPTSIPAGSYTTVTVTGTGNAVLGGAVVVLTGLTVQAGGSLSTSCQPLTGAGSFTLAAGATLAVCDPNGLSATGPTGAVQVTGTRTYSTDALYAYVGSAAQATGAGLPATVRSLSLANAAGLTLTQDLTVTTALAVTTGVLTTGSARATLGSAAALSETETAYVVGLVATTRLLAPGAAESFGGLGLTLAPAAGSASPGPTLVLRRTGTALTGAGSSVSVLRNFDIQPAVNAGLNVDLTFSYFTHELNGIAPANLALFKSETGATGPWATQRLVTLNAGANTVGKTGVASFSIWTLGNATAPLPVALTAFTAERQGAAALLAWATATEQHSAYFEAEASADGRAFHPVGRVAAQGNSAQSHAYQLCDPGLLAYGPALVYYRLRQVDLDGTATFSPVRAVRAVDGPAQLALYPNPAHAEAWVRGAEAGSPVAVFDALGRRVAQATAGPDGTAHLALPVGLAAGIYSVTNGQQVLRLAVE
jgi:hypothetical protein